jgi:hypothetical protein
VVIAVAAPLYLPAWRAERAGAGNNAAEASRTPAPEVTDPV